MCKMKEMAVRHEESRVAVGRRLLAKPDDGRFWKRQSSTRDVLPSRDASESRRARRRLHVFTGTESELRKIISKLCEWYGVKVPGILKVPGVPGSGRRDVQEIEILGRTLRWRNKVLSTKRRTSINWRFCRAWV